MLGFESNQLLQKRIFNMAIADFNGDSLPDLAYYGTPQELVLQFNGGANGYRSRTIRRQGWSPDAERHDDGDLNGDLKTTALLAEGKLCFYQAESGGLESYFVPYTGEVKSVQA